MTDQQPVRPFADFIAETNRGRTHDTLTAELHDLVAAVQQHGRKGTLTLTLTVAPLAKGDDSQFTVTEEVKTSKPKADPRPSIYFVDRAGNLNTDDPNALPLPVFRDLPDTPAPRGL